MIVFNSYYLDWREANPYGVDTSYTNFKRLVAGLVPGSYKEATDEERVEAARFISGGPVRLCKPVKVTGKTQKSQWKKKKKKKSVTTREYIASFFD